jgi:acetyl-CoA carboxylase, biotin carboxylase subunit
LFKKILIANRGEIAVRIIRACKELGIISAAIYSEADANSLHARLADEAYFIGPSPSAESYLNQEKIIELIKSIGADAVHPGYGFFSENADFIEALEKENINFIGPSSGSVKLMGSKTAARSLMKKNGVPIVPGTTSPIKNIKEGISEAKNIGYPILLKAASGGGGKGMRRVDREEDFESSFEATQREALKSFADDSIYIEKFIDKPKHIEVQIIADKFGNYVHLFERDCSIQRRHQKIIEESPSSFVDEITRNKITTAAINAAIACSYHNAGTIEFLMDLNKNFYFLEMNTRLQVEHPVTEEIAGIDLVKEQISIALGNKLSFSQDDIKINGHAFECRIYAEDPANNFLPSTGRLAECKHPSGPGVRVDAGCEAGSNISIYYDPLIAKLICKAGDRKSALDRMKRALDEYHIAGVTTNVSFLKNVISNSKFISGEFDINFIENEKENLEKYADNFVEDAATILAVLLKSRSSFNNYHESDSGRKISANKWSDQLNE